MIIKKVIINSQSLQYDKILPYALLNNIVTCLNFSIGLPITLYISSFQFKFWSKKCPQSGMMKLIRNYLYKCYWFYSELQHFDYGIDIFCNSSFWEEVFKKEFKVVNKNRFRTPIGNKSTQSLLSGIIWLNYQNAEF